MNDLKYHNTTSLQKLGNFIGAALGKSTGEVNTLTAIANQPVTISPLVYIIPVIAVGIFGIIYFTVIKK